MKPLKLIALITLVWSASVSTRAGDSDNTSFVIDLREVTAANYLGAMRQAADVARRFDTHITNQNLSCEKELASIIAGDPSASALRRTLDQLDNEITRPSILPPDRGEFETANDYARRVDDHRKEAAVRSERVKVLTSEVEISKERLKERLQKLTADFRVARAKESAPMCSILLPVSPGRFDPDAMEFRVTSPCELVSIAGTSKQVKAGLNIFRDRLFGETYVVPEQPGVLVYLNRCPIIAVSSFSTMDQARVYKDHFYDSSPFVRLSLPAAPQISHGYDEGEEGGRRQLVGYKEYRGARHLYRVLLPTNTEAIVCMAERLPIKVDNQELQMKARLSSPTRDGSFERYVYWWESVK
jgi:hypothetical protein